MLKIPEGFEFTHGTHIHISRRDPRPHLTGTLHGRTVHIYYHGQTTLPMFDPGVGHDVHEVQRLHERFPDVFRNSGFGRIVFR
ncbi:MAG: hypothetical protein DRG83_03800 [Deltaproteobacteria bacterium]|nr:MAG: hypothetical protein DRG83_03800 [Deltaproteobacteria bacterium]